MEPSAVTARLTRISLALAVGGAIVLMAGVALVLISEVMRLEHPARLQSLMAPGALLAFLGFALGVSAAIAIFVHEPVQPPVTRPPAVQPPVAHPLRHREPADQSLRGQVVPGEALTPPWSPGLLGRVAAGLAIYGEAVPGDAPDDPARHGGGHDQRGSGHDQRSAEWAGSGWPEYSPDGQPVSFGEATGYSDQGWGAAVAGHGESGPPAEPPQEIHHPVRR
ncbi:MAG: hypothetical protein ACRDNZ_09310 [Streptosporangiaceae bacterium]